MVDPLVIRECRRKKVGGLLVENLQAGLGGGLNVDVKCRCSRLR